MAKPYTDPLELLYDEAKCESLNQPDDKEEDSVMEIAAPVEASNEPEQLESSQAMKSSGEEDDGPI